MKRAVFITAIGITLAGCAAPSHVAQKTSLEIQAVQAKSFEADKGVAFKSVLSVMQDLGYVVSLASLETGFITAESPTKRDTSGGAVFAQIMSGVRTEGKTVVTASVEEFSNTSTRVRLNFVNKQFRSSQMGQTASDDAPIQDPKVYENAFEKISEAIFIRKAQK